MVALSWPDANGSWGPVSSLCLAMFPADIAKGAHDPFFHALEAAEIDVAVVVLQHLHDLLADWDAVHE